MDVIGEEGFSLKTHLVTGKDGKPHLNGRTPQTRIKGGSYNE